MNEKLLNQIEQKRQERREHIITLVREIGGEDAVTRVLRSSDTEDHIYQQVRRIEKAHKELQLLFAPVGA
jgi:hypothetical protein